MKKQTRRSHEEKVVAISNGRNRRQNKSLEPTPKGAGETVRGRCADRGLWAKVGGAAQLYVRCFSESIGNRRHGQEDRRVRTAGVVGGGRDVRRGACYQVCGASQPG